MLTIEFVYVLGMASANHQARPLKKPLPFAETWEVEPRIASLTTQAHKVPHDPPVQPGHHDTEHSSCDQEERVQSQ
jgi:hypothetical protein